MIVHFDWICIFSDIRNMTDESLTSKKEPIYKRSPWLPRGEVRKLIFLGLIILGGYGSTQHWSFIPLLLISIIALSPKVLLATAYYYGRSALFLGQWFSN
jgi:hypothetical protein